jgi:polar amino acid transport system substrate-binding protein
MNKILGVALSLVLAAVPLKSLAEPLLERIERTGKLRAGAWKDAKPFGYVNEEGKWVGYGIDIMTVIKSQVETALEKPIQLELIEVNTQNFLDRVRNDEIDISCGPTSFTWNREKYIDFSISYFVTGTQLLVKKGVTIDSVAQLKTKRLGVEPNTTNEAVLTALFK